MPPTLMERDGMDTTAEDEEGGFRCPNCHCRHHHVTNTWQREVKLNGKTKTIIRRRRVCRHCLVPFTTIETHEEDLDGMMNLSPKKTVEPPPDPDTPPKNPFL